MHESETFLKEKKEIDYLLRQKFQIKKIEENLYGAFFTYQLENKANKTQIKTLRICTADARKYLTNRLYLTQKEAG